MSAQTLIWYGIAGGAAAVAASLLYARYVRREPQMVAAGSGLTLFALLMLLFAVGALAAGVVSGG
ncbi:MAG: hypothetical protein ACR2LS_00810 [Thermomicrobiales bacterium]